MKKLILLITTLLLAFSLFACSNNNPSSPGGGENQFLGNIIPKPTMEYDIYYAYDDSLYLKVSNADESDFRTYVDSCSSFGFNGYIHSATLPDLYFMEYNGEGYFIEIRFMEDEQEFSVFIQAPNK